MAALSPTCWPGRSGGAADRLRRRNPDPQLLLRRRPGPRASRPQQAGTTGPVNIGNPAEITILELASEVLAVTGSTSAVVFEPLPQDDPARRQPDISLARRLLGGEPAVSLTEGLRRTADWLAAQPETGNRTEQPSAR